MKFVDDVRHIYLDNSGTGPATEDMISFLSSSPELARREYTFLVFKRFCLCFGYNFPNLPKVELGSGGIGTFNVDLSCVIEPLQGNHLSTDSERNFFTDPESKDAWLVSPESFSDKAL